MGRGHKFEPAAGDPGPNGIYARPCARGPNMLLRRDDPNGVIEADMHAKAHSLHSLPKATQRWVASWQPAEDLPDPKIDNDPTLVEARRAKADPKK